MHHGTPGDEFDDGMLMLIRAVKEIFFWLSIIATGLLVLYASYLVLGSLFYLLHAVLQ